MSKNVFSNNKILAVTNYDTLLADTYVLGYLNNIVKDKRVEMLLKEKLEKMGRIVEELVLQQITHEVKEYYSGPEIDDGEYPSNEDWFEAIKKKDYNTLKRYFEITANPTYTIEEMKDKLYEFYMYEGEPDWLASELQEELNCNEEQFYETNELIIELKQKMINDWLDNASDAEIKKEFSKTPIDTIFWIVYDAGGERFAQLCDLLIRFKQSPTFENLDRIINWMHYSGTLLTGSEGKWNKGFTKEMADKISYSRSPKDLIPYLSPDVKKILIEYRGVLASKPKRLRKVMNILKGVL